jgi:hypothetical protein
MTISLPPRWRGAALVVAMIALAQLPFWLVQTRVALQRPLINLDLLVAIVLMLRWRALGLAALVLAWVVEIDLDASTSYHFVGAADLADALRFMELVRLDRLFSWQILFAVIIFALCGACMYRLARPNWPAALAIAFIGGVAFLVDGVNGSNATIGQSDHFGVDLNVAGSPSVTTLRGLRSTRLKTAEPMARLPEPVSFARASAWHEQHPRDSMLMVLVESMGLPVSLPVRDWLIARLDTPEIEKRWSVEPGSEAYFGSTVYGELRVLCGLKGHYSRLKAEDREQCLPRRFVQDGGEAVGLHGFNLRMFDRRIWWPGIDIRPDDLGALPAVPSNVGCNAVFAGVCDGPVLQRASELVQHPARLVYVVTLDTHLPLPSEEMPLAPGLAPLCEQDRLSRDACQMVNRLAFLLGQLRTDLAKMPHPVAVFVSGDHAPPFLGAASRDAFDRMRVLSFALQPR